MMRDAWEQHIQPLLGSYQVGNFSTVVDPFLERYAELPGKQRIVVEDTLVRCAFESSDDEMARKALTLAVALHKSKLATGGLERLMRNELRNQLGSLNMDRGSTKDYVFALSEFGLTEAVPSIRDLAASIRDVLMSGDLDEAGASNRSLLRACCLSLKRLGDDRADDFVATLVEYDLRRNALTTSDLDSLRSERIVQSWDRLGLGALRSITETFRGLQADQRSRAVLLLEEAVQGIEFHSGRERQEVMDLVEGLRRADEAQITSSPDDRVRGIRRKRSIQNALTGLVLSVISLGFLVALLVLGLSFSVLPRRGTIFGVITILVLLTFAFASALSTLYEVRTFRTNKVAYVLAVATLAFCILILAGLGVLASLILSVVR